MPFRVNWLGGWLVVVAGVLAIAGVTLAVDHPGHIHIPLAPSTLIAAFLFGLLGSTHCFEMAGFVLGIRSWSAALVGLVAGLFVILMETHFL